MLDSAGPTQWGSGVQFSMLDKEFGMSGSAPEPDLSDAIESDLLMGVSIGDDVLDQ